MSRYFKLEAEICVSDDTDFGEGAIDACFEEYLEHTLPDFLEVDDYNVVGRNVFCSFDN